MVRIASVPVMVQPLGPDVSGRVHFKIVRHGNFILVLFIVIFFPNQLFASPFADHVPTPFRVGEYGPAWATTSGKITFEPKTLERNYLNQLIQGSRVSLYMAKWGFFIPKFDLSESCQKKTEFVEFLETHKTIVNVGGRGGF